MVAISLSDPANAVTIASSLTAEQAISTFLPFLANASSAASLYSDAIRCLDYRGTRSGDITTSVGRRFSA